MGLALDSAQHRTLEAFKKGHSIALLGSAGSGKSLLIHMMLEYARENIGQYPRVIACAHTHQASTAIGGRTVSSVFGIYANWAVTKEKLLDEVKKSKWRSTEIRMLQVLIIEEVFLLTSETLEAIDAVLRHLCGTDTGCALPFRGRQVVLSGDIFQLGPVEQYGSLPSENQYVQLPRPWNLTFGGFRTGVVSILSGNHRQHEDEEFYTMLQRIRFGKGTEGDIMRINSTSNSIKKPCKTHTKLFLYRSQVSEYNDKRLRNIPGKLYHCHAEDIYSPGSERNQISRTDIADRLKRAAPDVLRVKVGAEVLLTRKSRSCIPGTKVLISDIVLGTSSNVMYLKCRIGDTDVEHTLKKEDFSIRSRDTSVLATRKQFPIIPAYAVTFHKCQGLTLENVAIEFKPGRWKPNGMVYVALSRCKTLKGLWVKGLTKDHIHASPAAEGYMKHVAKLQAHYPNRVISKNSGL